METSILDKLRALYTSQWQAFMFRKMADQVRMDEERKHCDDAAHGALVQKGFLRHNGAMDVTTFFETLFPRDSERGIEKRIEKCTQALQLGGKGGRVRFPAFTFDRIHEKIILRLDAIPSSKVRVQDGVHYIHRSYFTKTLKPTLLKLFAACA